METKSLLRKSHCAWLALAAATTGALGQEPAERAAQLWDFLSLDSRIRFESVDQETLDSSEALTARARLGLRGDWQGGFQILAEGEFSEPLDEDDFDAWPGPQGEPGKALIPDGPTRELNRAELSWHSEEGWNAVLGRQRIVIGNARFVGNVGWRQNEQTYDAATLEYSPEECWKLAYSYLDRVNRVFGSEAENPALRSLESSSHAFRGVFSPQEGSEYGFYWYSIGLPAAAPLSSDTIGAYFAGKSAPDGDIQLRSRFEFATQMENSYSPAGADYTLDYWHLLVGASKDRTSGEIGYERLEGDGQRGFSTPLATLHAFNGWADAFLATPANGLVDLYASIGYRFSKSLSGKFVYHNFDSDHGSIRYASEYDAVLTWKIDGRNTLTAKYAFYNGTGQAPGALKLDRTKFWLQLESSY